MLCLWQSYILMFSSLLAQLLFQAYGQAQDHSHRPAPTLHVQIFHPGFQGVPENPQKPFLQAQVRVTRLPAGAAAEVWDAFHAPSHLNPHGSTRGRFSLDPALFFFGKELSGRKLTPLCPAMWHQHRLQTHQCATGWLGPSWRTLGYLWAELGFQPCLQIWGADSSFSLSPSSLTWLMDCRPVLPTLPFASGGDFLGSTERQFPPVQRVRAKGREERHQMLSFFLVKSGGNYSVAANLSLWVSSFICKG